MAHTSFVVRFVMAAPVILTDGASLDAVIAFQGFASGGDGVDLLDQLLEKEGRIHRASWMYCEQEHLAARAGFVRMQRLGAALNENTLLPTGGTGRDFRVDNKRGVAANKLTSYRTIATPSVWAFATGDAAGVAEMLSDVTSIGIKRPYGFGRVQRIEIGRVDGWAGFGHLMPDGRPARAIPLDQWQGDGKRGAYALGFPRWASPAETCAIPTERLIDPTIFNRLEPQKSWVVGMGGHDD